MNSFNDDLDRGPYIPGLGYRDHCQTCGKLRKPNEMTNIFGECLECINKEKERKDKEKANDVAKTP